MNLFDILVNEALENQPEFSTLRVVVEKELLHHDILRILNESNLLHNLTFIGGTCLRACYGGTRLSEDLDFTGGKDFSRSMLSEMGSIIIQELYAKYGLAVQVSEPIKDIKNVDTWKIKIETRPEKKYFPAQKINIDICAIKSYEKVPMLLLNPYHVDMGTSGLVIQAESREELYVDKLLALALRPNRIKYRDLWDIVWLHQKGIQPRFTLLMPKLEDRIITNKYFLNLFDQRKNLLATNTSLATEFKDEMSRFLPAEQIKKTIEQANLWHFIIYLLNDLYDQMKKI